MSLLPGRSKEVDQGVSEQTRLLITSGAQQIEHKLAGMLGGGEESSPRSSLEKFVAPAQLTAPASASQLPSSVQIVVMSPDDSRIADWVSDVTSQIIEGETRE